MITRNVFEPNKVLKRIYSWSNKWNGQISGKLVTDPINNILSKAYLMLFLIIQVLKQFMLWMAL